MPISELPFSGLVASSLCVRWRGNPQQPVVHYREMATDKQGIVVCLCCVYNTD